MPIQNLRAITPSSSDLPVLVEIESSQIWINSPSAQAPYHFISARQRFLHHRTIKCSGPQDDILDEVCDALNHLPLCLLIPALIGCGLAILGILQCFTYTIQSFAHWDFIANNPTIGG